MKQVETRIFLQSLALALHLSILLAHRGKVFYLPKPTGGGSKVWANANDRKKTVVFFLLILVHAMSQTIYAD
jgi:hypothetical protein